MSRQHVCWDNMVSVCILIAGKGIEVPFRGLDQGRDDITEGRKLL